MGSLFLIYVRSIFLSPNGNFTKVTGSCKNRQTMVKYYRIKTLRKIAKKEIIMNLLNTKKYNNEDIDLDIVENTYTLENFTSLEIRNPICCNIEIVKTDYPQCRLYTKGTKYFSDKVKFEVIEDTCKICIDTDDLDFINGYVNHKNITENDIIVLYVNFNLGENLYVGISGSGKVSSTIPFNYGTLKLSSSGNIIATDFVKLDAMVSGSGNISVKSIKNTADIKICSSGNVNAELIGTESNIKIYGSGNADIKEIFGNLSAIISSSGNIILHKGQVDNLNAKIAGPGALDGSGLDVCNADIKIVGSGKVTVHKISEKFEFNGNPKKIKILDRV